MKKEKKIEWVVVRGKRVPKHQLEEALKGLDELMDDHETQYRRMEQGLKDPEKEFDVNTLLYWAHIFKNDAKYDLVGLAHKKIVKIFERNLNGESSLSELTFMAMIYGQDLEMPEKTLDIMDEIGAKKDSSEHMIAMAELSVGALGDRMAAAEYYRDAEKLLKDLKERCLLAESVIEHYDKAWGEDIYYMHVKRELEYPCFEYLFPAIDVLENLDIDLADEGKKELLELAKSDKNKLMQFLHTPWASEFESEIKKMLKEVEE